MSEQEVAKKLHNKVGYTLNITDGMTARIRRNAETLIDQLSAQKVRIMPDLDEKRGLYELAKEEFERREQEYRDLQTQVENINAEIREQQVVIETMKSYNKIEGQKKLVVHGEPPAQADKTSAKRISWLDEAHAVLAKELRFIPAKELVARIIEQPSIREVIKNMQSHPTVVRTGGVGSIETHAEYTAAGRHRTSPRFRPVLTLYNGVVGLHEWVDEHNVPRPEFMKQFMFK